MKYLVFLFVIFSTVIYGQSLQLGDSLLEEQTAYTPIEDEQLEAPNIPSLNAVSSGDSILPEQVVRKNHLNKILLKRADAYFDKLWYAEAAKTYDQLLKNKENLAPFAVLHRAGDAHYFSGAIEKAHYWYEKLYAKSNARLSDEDMFKYIHSLKGTGRHEKARRLVNVLQFGREDATDQQKRKSIDSLALEKTKEVALENLKINSKYSDFSPTYYDKSSLVYASAYDTLFLTTRKYKWTNQPYLDLYLAKKTDSSQNFKRVSPFSKKINSKYHEASVAFSPDKKTIYFTRNNYGKKLGRSKKGVNHLKIYRSSLVGDSWSKPKELPFNNDDYSTGHPTVSPDGKLLYFVSDRPGGFGSTDIYVADIKENGNFSEPRNLGRTVNTSKKEMFPYITDDKLYFSSDREMGFGGLDVYQSSYQDDFYSTAVNLGNPVNSGRDDFSYIIDEEAKTGYFASNRKGGKGDDDIYSFEITEKEVQPETKSSLSGIVVNEVTGEKIPNASISVMTVENEILLEVTGDENGGFFLDSIPSNSLLNVKITKEGYVLDTSSFNTSENDTIALERSLKPIPKEILIPRDTIPSNVIVEKEPAPPDDPIVTENGERKINIDPILFRFDSDRIDASAQNALKKLVVLLRQSRNMKIRIESHTDSRGSSSYNQSLSSRRAASTKEYLISQGIAPEQIVSATGYGENQLLNSCGDGVYCTQQQHRRNRRSEFIIVQE